MPPKKKTESEKPAVRGLFDHINSIYQEQDRKYWSKLNDAEKRTYSPYMVNRFLSMNVHQLPLVNEIQKYTMMHPQFHYLFYIGVLPKGRQFNKYIKSKKEDKYEKWIVELVAKHYEISQSEALTYVEIYYTSEKESLRELCELYGIEPKQIKKAKL